MGPPVRTYHIADLALQSTIALPELAAAPEGGAGWTVVVDPRRHQSVARWSHYWRDAGGRRWLSIGRIDDEHLIRFAGASSFRVSPDRRRITCEGVTRVPAGSLRHLLLDQVLPLALGCERIVLHASAVGLPGGVVAFAGPGGAGKSTLAAALGREGARLLTDDAVIVERGQAGWWARAIYGSLRLWPDAADALFGSRAPSAPVAHYTGKRRIDVGALRPPAEPAPLAAVCLLTGTRGRPAPTSLKRLTAGEALVALTAASFHLDIHDRERWRRVIEDLACVAEAVPVFALSYPRRLSSLAAAAREVLDRLTTTLAG